MHQQIYVNLPCRDLAASKAFFEAMGYQFHPQFTNDYRFNKYFLGLAGGNGNSPVPRNGAS